MDEKLFRELKAKERELKKILKHLRVDEDSVVNVVKRFLKEIEEMNASLNGLEKLEKQLKE